MKTDIVLLQGTVEKIKGIAEEAFRGVPRKLLSAPDVVEDMSEKDKGVGWFWLKARPVVIKKIKMQQHLRFPLGEVQPPPKVMEHSMLCIYLYTG